MKKLNKNGFTLVELLAVIVVLAVIMLLAVNAVLPQMNKARKNAFVTEAESVINAASSYYQTMILTGEDDNMTATGGCVSVEKLKGGYLEKNDTDFTGSVKIAIDQTTNVATYTIWLSNGEFAISNKAGAEIKAANVTASTAAASTTCSGS